MQILLQRIQRHGGWPRVAVGSQGQVHPEHKAMLGGVAHQSINGAHHLAKVLVVGDAATAMGVTGGVAVFVVNVDQVDVA